MNKEKCTIAIFLHGAKNSTFFFSFRRYAGVSLTKVTLYLKFKKFCNVWNNICFRLDIKFVVTLNLWLNIKLNIFKYFKYLYTYTHILFKQRVSSNKYHIMVSYILYLQIRIWYKGWTRFNWKNLTFCGEKWQVLADRINMAFDCSIQISK